jgi:DNA invertase Pin-like site-specific DNA recombinase
MLMPTAPVIYARISQTDTLKGVERQVRTLKREAEELGLPEPEVFMDNDLSSKEGIERPDFDRMWSLIRAGVKDGIMVWKMDRYSRETYHYDWVKKYKPIVITSGKRVYDPNNSEDMHALRGEASSAERETKRLSERLLGQREDDAMAGLRHGAPAFGWGYRSKKGKWKDRDTANPEEKALLLDGMERVIAGESLANIMRVWNASGIKTSRGSAWNTTSVRHVLARWSNAGVRQHQGQPLLGVEVTWEPLCDLPRLRQVQALLGSNPRNTTSGRARRHLLTGILTCECGSLMKAQHIRSSARMVAGVEPSHAERVPTHYKCEGFHCGRSVPYAAADAFVLSWLGNHLLFKGASAFLSAGDQALVSELSERLNGLQADREKIKSLSLSVVDKAELLKEVFGEESSVRAILDTMSARTSLGRLVSGLIPAQHGNEVSLEQSAQNRHEVVARFQALDLKIKKKVLNELATFTVGIGFSEPSLTSGRRRKLTAAERIRIEPLAH